MARLSVFSRELKLYVDAALSPEARKALIADAAAEALSDAQAQNRDMLGIVPGHEQIVDRVRGAPFAAVNPDRGVIVIEFDIRLDVFAYIGKLLVENSPVLTGDYQDSHQLYADGVPVSKFDPAMQADEWVFLSTVPYARKIERGQSDQAPDGVYQAVAAMASRRFGNIASVKFTFRSLSNGRGKEGQGDRQPAILVRLL